MVANVGDGWSTWVVSQTTPEPTFTNANYSTSTVAAAAAPDSTRTTSRVSGGLGVPGCKVTGSLELWWLGDGVRLRESCGGPWENLHRLCFSGLDGVLPCSLCSDVFVFLIGTDFRILAAT
jgi:hypothetical protein